MSASLFLVDALPDGDRFRLDGSEGHHAATVRRLRPGECLLLGDGAGGLAEAEVVTAGNGFLEVLLGGRRTVPAPDPRLAVVQGIAKGDRAELAVQAMTEVGVDEIVPWAAARSVTRWKDDRPLRRWRSTAREAAKQARRAWLPAVSAPATTADLTRELTRRPVGSVLLLHEEARVRLSTVDLPASGTVTLVVGPEGGVAPEELAAFEAAGATAVRLGDEILRTSTAGTAALAVLAVRLGRW